MKIKAGNILFNIFVIVTVIAVVFVGFNLISGAKGYAVTSPSMKDTLAVGDIVFVKSVSFEQLQVGDVVTVASSDGKSFFTHRVVGINTDDRTITTRGDANGSDDPMPTEADRIVGRMWYSVPLIGYPAVLIGSAFSGSAALIIGVVFVAALVGLNTILPKILSKKKRGDSDE